MKLDPTIQIEMCPGVYAPAEDTFLLLSAVEVRESQHVLEMGCGTGIIALHCAGAGCRVTAVDVFDGAVENARMNAAINNLGMELAQSDLFENVKGKFDVIIFNPPYLSSRDSEGLSEAERRPLVGGDDGSGISTRFLETAPDFLAPGGRVYLLSSSESEAAVMETARELFSARRVAEKRIFFETLAVYELRLGEHSER